MTSEQNLTDEGELQEEEKPRLVINEDAPSSLHHGHKLDMKDRDPIKMNDHVKFTEIIFIDHQTGSKAYFKRQANQSITAADNYGKTSSTYGLWDGVGTSDAYSYQLLICDHSFYNGFFVSGYTNNCYKVCNNWCGDNSSPYFRTASSYKGVAFNTSGHLHISNRLVSVGLR